MSLDQEINNNYILHHQKIEWFNIGMGIIVKRAIITQNDEDDDSLARPFSLSFVRWGCSNTGGDTPRMCLAFDDIVASSSLSMSPLL